MPIHDGTRVEQNIWHDSSPRSAPKIWQKQVRRPRVPHIRRRSRRCARVCLPVEVEYASEFRYRNPAMDRDTRVFACTLCGDIADTLAAMRESRRMGHTALAICKVIVSTFARETDDGVYLHAGTEIGVASTKAFTSQVCVLAMLALYFGRTRHLSSLQTRRIVEELRALPEKARRALECHDRVKKIARHYCEVDNVL